MTAPSPFFAKTAPPDFTVHSPGRVNLIGEHTDYNDGLVFPMAIDRGLSFRVRRRADGIAVLRSNLSVHEVAFDLGRPLLPGPTHWSAYAAGVLAGYQRLGWSIPGFNVDISTTLPSGGGLSSSAALEVGIATVVEVLCGQCLPRKEKALLCQQAEHEFAHVPCGIMDQFAVTYGQAGHALLLDCQSLKIQPVPLSDEVGVLIIDTGVKHQLANSAYARRRAECASAAKILGVASLRQMPLAGLADQQAELPEAEMRRARHVISEHARTIAFSAALRRKDWVSAGQAMYDSHNSLDHDFQVSCQELNALVSIARGTEGVYGCRMTGGGFGGSVVALIDPALAGPVQEKFHNGYRARTGFAPSLFLTGAMGGPSTEW